MIAMFFVPPEQFTTLLVLHVAGSLIAGPTAPLVWAMYADVADYGEWQFGERTTGLVFSASIFAQKFGGTIGAGMAGWLLAAFGYVANVDQSEDALLGIRLLFTLIPAGIAALNVIVLLFYDLTDDKVAEIEQELAKRADG